jgi:ribosomal protein L29
MKLKDLKNKTKEEVQEILDLRREKLRDLRFKDSNKQLKNIREIRLIKKEIAQILTFKNQKKV